MTYHHDHVDACMRGMCIPPVIMVSLAAALCQARDVLSCPLVKNTRKGSVSRPEATSTAPALHHLPSFPKRVAALAGHGHASAAGSPSLCGPTAASPIFITSRLSVSVCTSTIRIVVPTLKYHCTPIALVFGFGLHIGWLGCSVRTRLE